MRSLLNDILNGIIAICAKYGRLHFYHKMPARKRHKGCRIDVEYWMGTGLMLLDKTYPILFCMLRMFYYSLTHSLTMVQSPSWEANWFAASQEIPRISRNPKVHYRTHKHPPPVSIFGQANPVHIPTSHILETHPNTIHPSTPRSPQWSLSLRFPHQDPIHPLLLTHMRHMPSPSHSLFYHPHNIGWGVQII